MTRAKDLPDAIQWHEGMLLAPQHFQLLARRTEALVAYHVLAGAPFAWGVRKLEFDAGLLSNGTLRITQLEAVLPDGMPLAHSAEEPTGAAIEVKLEPYIAEMQRGSLRIYLAVVAPGYKESDAGGGGRYQSVAGSAISDENESGDAIEIPRLRPNVQLLAGEAPSNRYISFQIATVTRQNEIYKLGDYIPPLLEVSPDGLLWQTCDALTGQLREKGAFLAKQTMVSSSSVDDRVHMLELRERLRSVVTGLPFLEAILKTRSVHPYALYIALCNLIGPLSLLKPGGVPPVPPSYRHDDLRRSFNAVLSMLEEMVDAVKQTYSERKFKYLDGMFAALIDEEWLETRLVVGLSGRSEQELSEWLNGSLISSDDLILTLREKRILGAQRGRIDTAEELGVVSGGGVTLFEIDISAGFVLPGRQLVIANPSSGAVALQPSDITLYVKS